MLMRRLSDCSGTSRGYAVGAFRLKNRPEDFQKLREAFEIGVANEVVSEP